MRSVVSILERSSISLDVPFAVTVEKPDSGAIGQPGHVLEIETDTTPPPTPQRPRALVRVTRHHGSTTETSISFGLFTYIEAAAYENLGVMTRSALLGPILWVPTARDYHYWGLPYRTQSFFHKDSRPAYRLEAYRIPDFLSYVATNQNLLVEEVKRFDLDLKSFLPFVREV
jgi:hypothetical protein